MCAQQECAPFELCAWAGAPGVSSAVQDRLPVVRVPVLSKAIVEHCTSASSTRPPLIRMPLQARSRGSSELNQRAQKRQGDTADSVPIAQHTCQCRLNPLHYSAPVSNGSWRLAWSDARSSHHRWKAARSVPVEERGEAAPAADGGDGGDIGEGDEDEGAGGRRGEQAERAVERTPPGALAEQGNAQGQQPQEGGHHGRNHCPSVYLPERVQPAAQLRFLGLRASSSVTNMRAEPAVPCPPGTQPAPFCG